MASPRGIRAGRAFVEIGADDKLTAALKRARARLQAFGAAARRVGSQLTKVAAGPLLAGGFATRLFAGFDDRMRVVQAVTGATQEQFEALTEEAKRLGRTTSFTAAQVADAMAELGRAGFDASEILAATNAVLDLARATASDLPRATEIAGAALRGFGLGADQMTRVVDVLTATANTSAQTLEDLFEGLKLVAPIAVQAGESIETVSAALGILANNGIKGSLAGTALARAYKNLSTELKQRELQTLGIDATDAAGNLRPLADILVDIGSATAGLGSAQRLAIFESLFGRGQAAALALSSATAQFESLRQEIEAAGGSAARTAAQMDAGIGGALRRLLSAAEGVAIAIGDALAGAVGQAADRLGELAAWVTSVVTRNRELVVTIVKVAAGIGAVGAALIAIGGVASLATTALGGMAAVASAVATAIGAIASPVGIVIGLVAGLGAAIVHFGGATSQVLEFVGQKFGELQTFVGGVVQGLADALAAGDLQLAAQIGLAGLRSAFVAATTKISQIWIAWTTSLAEALLVIRDTALNTFDRIATAAANALESAQTSIAKGIISAANALGVDKLVLGVELSDADVRQANRLLDQQREQASRSRSRARVQRQAEREARLQEQIAALEEQKQADLASVNEELDAQIARLKTLRDQARRAREQHAAEPGAELDVQAPDAESAIRSAAQAIAAASTQIRSAASRGTFNALAALSLQGTAADRTARATEETAENTRKILNRMAESSDLSFA